VKSQRVQMPVEVVISSTDVHLEIPLISTDVGGGSAGLENELRAATFFGWRAQFLKHQKNSIHP
jgi:hypothetical protein